MFSFFFLKSHDLSFESTLRFCRSKAGGSGELGSTALLGPLKRLFLHSFWHHLSLESKLQARVQVARTWTNSYSNWFGPVQKMSYHFQNININNYPQGRERKCKVDDFRKQGVGLPWGLKAPVTWEVEGLAPDGESLGRQLRAMQGALERGGGLCR